MDVLLEPKVWARHIFIIQQTLFSLSSKHYCRQGCMHLSIYLLKQCAGAVSCVKPPVVECSRKRSSRWHLSVHGI